MADPKFQVGDLAFHLIRDGQGFRNCSYRILHVRLNHINGEWVYTCRSVDDDSAATILERGLRPESAVDRLARLADG